MCLQANSNYDKLLWQLVDYHSQVAVQHNITQAWSTLPQLLTQPSPCKAELEASERALRERCASFQEQVAALLESQDEACHQADSLAVELVTYPTKIQEALKGCEESQLEIAQPKNKLVAETEQGLHLTKKKDWLFSQLLAWGYHLD